MLTISDLHHQKGRPRRTDRRESSYRRGYTKGWYRASEAFKQRMAAETADMMCRICGERTATETDHIVPPSQKGPIGSPAYVRWFWDESNWQLACKPCNSAKQNRIASDTK